MMSRAELDAIRASNRARLGLAGYTPRGLGIDTSAASVLFGNTSARVQTSFPETDFTWAPGVTAPVQVDAGTPWGEWLLAHVVRPRVQVSMGDQVIELDPYRERKDYSGFAKFFALLAGAGTAFSLAWLLVRAFWPTRRAR